MPHLGSSYADWLSPLAQLFGHAQADALRFVRHNDWLQNLDKEFTNLKEAGKLKIKGKELVEDKFLVLKKLWRRQVVEGFSGARYFGEPFKVPKSDHSSIAKPEDKGAIQHRLLCQFVKDLLEASTRPLSRALVLVDVGAEPDDHPPPFTGTEMLATKYVVCTQDAQTRTKPDSDYLAAVRAGQRTKAFCYSPNPFPLCVPLLKIRILNNSNGQIVVNQVALAVERSSPTVEALLVVVDHRRPKRSILVANEGAGESGPCTIRYVLLPITDTNEPGFADFPYAVTTDGFDHCWLADLSDGLAAEGLDLQAFDALKSVGSVISSEGAWQRTQSGELILSEEWYERTRQLCGRWSSPKARVIGCLERRGDSRTGGRIFFESSVSFNESVGDFPLRPKPQEWDLTLSVERAGYEVAIPAGHVVKSGESTELKIRVGAKRPSRHLMSVQVTYNHDRVASSPPVDLRIFVPRSSYDDRSWE